MYLLKFHYRDRVIRDHAEKTADSYLLFYQQERPMWVKARRKIASDGSVTWHRDSTCEEHRRRMAPLTTGKADILRRQEGKQQHSGARLCHRVIRRRLNWRYNTAFTKTNDPLLGRVGNSRHVLEATKTIEISNAEASYLGSPQGKGPVRYLACTRMRSLSRCFLRR